MKKKPKTSLIQLEIDGPIANVRLARPDKYNAMNVQMITELIEVFAWTAEHSVGSKGVLFSEDETPYLRVLTLSGEGKHFCEKVVLKTEFFLLLKLCIFQIELGL